MSRKGKLPISVPKSVELKKDGNRIVIKGPKGTLSQELVPGVEVEQKESQVTICVDRNDKTMNSFEGLYRTLIANMMFGVSTGFKKTLEMVGVGYRAAVKGKILDLQVGYSHPTELPIPEGIQVTVEKNSTIHIEGANKQLVGEFAGTIRAKRAPEPYQGKGIRYQGEYIRRKAGKSASKK